MSVPQPIKKLRCIQRSVDRHWVGDGFPVRTLLAYSNLGPVISPFLLLDYAGPAEFPPTRERRGVGEHPHRGFETVTLVYAGEVEHRDSSGGGGRIGPGDVQWMTAASGLVHEEFHGRTYAQRGGAGSARVIAGELAGAQGPAHTFTPMHVWDLRFSSDAPTELALPEGWTTALVVLRGSLRANGGEAIGAAEVGLFDRSGTRIQIQAAPGVTALLLCGAPIDEPIVGQGPFVMNRVEEIRAAIDDYRSGRMGRLS